MSFRALVLSQAADRKVSGAVETLSVDKLPAGDVTVAVDYSTLNYKDGLVLTTGGGLVKTWPHVGGIDFAGTVESSENPDFRPGDKVVLNGWRVGELHWGGYATKARVKGDWLVKLPPSISPRHAMAIGTAGYTSMLCVMALEKHGLKAGACSRMYRHSRFATGPCGRSRRLPFGRSGELAMKMSLAALNARMENVEPSQNLWGFATDQQIKSFVDLLVTSEDRLKVHGHLSTHVLDTHSGRPAAGIKVELVELSALGESRVVTRAITNSDGRTDAPFTE